MAASRRQSALPQEFAEAPAENVEILLSCGEPFVVAQLAPFDGNDPGCESTADDDEMNAVPAACADGTDNDGDQAVDREDPGCESADDDDETNAPTVACADGGDHDGDTLIDLGDPGCRSDTDDNETDPPGEPEPKG